MKLNEIRKLLGARLLTEDSDTQIELGTAFGCDLMSDVLALVNGDTILLTGLTNIQSVRTAEIKDIRCIIYVRGKVPDSQVIELAREKGICLMSTDHIMFTSCGILYANGLRGAEIL